MNITLSTPQLHGTIEAIPSKSHAHRLFIASAFADRPTVIECRALNRDISATIDCLTALGADIRETERGSYTVIPTTVRHGTETVTLDVGESGSTLRFMLPVALAAGAEASFVCHGRLTERPLSPLYEQLTEHGAMLSEKGSNPFFARGGLTGGGYELSGSVSSQFVTGLLLALPLVGESSTVTLTGRVESRPYIDITLRVLRDFGIKVAERDNTFTVCGRPYVSPGRLAVEGDWSNAAFFLVAGAFSRDGVTVRGLDMTSPQGDRAIVSLLREFGADVTIYGDCVAVRRAENVAPTAPIDAADIPDLIPILSVLAATAKGTTVIKNCTRLRLKESDRLMTICDTLTSLGANVRIEDDSLVIDGTEQLRGGTVSSCNDHRIAMAAAVASIVADGDVTILGAEAVEKSYPTFFEEFRSIACDEAK